MLETHGRSLLFEMNYQEKLSSIIVFTELASCISDTKPDPPTFELAEFNKFFVNIGENIKRSIPSKAIELPRDVNMSIKINRVSEIEVNAKIDSLPKKSPSGENEILIYWLTLHDQ